MKTELFSISKIFTERLLRIPDYQRGYAWTDKQLKDYWSDIMQLEVGHNHYVGVLTLEDAPTSNPKEWEDDLWIIESKCYEPYYVVDGQQRLTTTIILIQCLIEISEGKVLNYSNTCDIKKKFIYESKDEGISRSYLFGYAVDNPSYEFLKREIFGEKSDDHSAIEETIYTNNLAYAKKFFLEKISTLSFEDIEILYKKITQHLLFNIYSMSEEIDVHVSFETMNNRGKPLSHLELLKNRLIYLTTKFDTCDHERLKLRKAINDCWKTIYHQLGRNKDNPLDDDVFLYNHFILFFGSISKDDDFFDRVYNPNRNTYQDYLLETKFTVASMNCSNKDEQLTVLQLYQYVSSLKSSVEKWYEICNPENSNLSVEIIKWLQKIIRLKGNATFPLIMIVLQKEKDETIIIKFLSALERILFIYCFAGHSFYYGFNSILFVDYAVKLSNNELSLDKIITQLTERSDAFSKEDVLFKQISNALKDGGFYKWSGLRYFLFEYELHLMSLSKTYTDKLQWNYRDPRDHLTVEHIYPQNPRKKEWTELFSKYSSAQRAILRHTIGNLIPLSKSKNSSFQNKPFKDKIGNDKNKVGFRYGSLSENELTEYSKWTAIEILNRSVALIKFMEKRWGIKQERRSDILVFLRLDFVINIENLTYSSTSKSYIVKK
jgi:uncharacterized protein with ParB-like and HNH nuclease domain